MKRAPTIARDEGFSLVELIVAGAVSALLLGVIAIIFGQGLVAQQHQTARDAATGQLNAASAYLNESMRAAVAARTDVGGARLDMKLLNQAGTGFECRSWQIAEDTLWVSSGDGARGTWNNGWNKLASNVVDPSSGGETVGFTTVGTSFSYVLSVREGEIEVTIRDGGHPGTKSALETVGGQPCW